MRGCLWFVLGVMCWLGMGAAAGAKTIHVPADAATIQAGMDAAVNGDQVLVGPGTYLENLDFKGKAITVVSSDGAAKTVIDGQYKGVVVVFQTGELRDSVLSGFTITRGSLGQPDAEQGGGVVAWFDTSPTIENNLITGNDCAGVLAQNSQPVIRGNTIRGNADAGSAQYGARSCLGYSVGVAIEGRSNRIPYLGGEVVGNVIENHTAGDDTATDLYGVLPHVGGLFVTNAIDTIISGNVIRNNFAPGAAGGIFVLNPEGLVLTQNVIYGNRSQGDTGGLLIDSSFSEPWFTFAAVIANNTIVGNSTSASVDTSRAVFTLPSDVLFFPPRHPILFVNNIVRGSSAKPAIGCGFDNLLAPFDLQLLWVDHNDVLNAEAPAYGAECGERSGSYGNIAVDPMFVDAAHGDFHVKAGSPTVDAGNNSVLQVEDLMEGSPLVDAGANADLQDATGKGYAVIDMGAYESAGVANTAGTYVVMTTPQYRSAIGLPIRLDVKTYSAQGVPSGTVTFLDRGVAIGSQVLDATGAATLTIPVGGVTEGVHLYTATYPGNGVFAPGVSVLLYVYVRVDDGRNLGMSVGSSPNPSALGQSVSIRAGVQGPWGSTTGTVQFRDITNDAFHGTVLATVPLDAVASAEFSTSTLSEGKHEITADYWGNAIYPGANALMHQVVIGPLVTTTTLTSSLNPAVVGSSVTFTASVADTQGLNTPTGLVQFLDGAALLGTGLLSGGKVSFATNGLPFGAHSITAVYGGDTQYPGSTSGVLVETVEAAGTTTALTSSLNPSVAGQVVTFTSTVGGAAGSGVRSGVTGLATPTGTVTFLDQSRVLGTGGLTGGVATFSTGALAVGTHLIEAVYGGDAHYLGSDSAVVGQIVQVAVATIAVGSSMNPSVAGDAVTFSVHVGAVTRPAGVVELMDVTDHQSLVRTALSAQGNASFTTRSLTVGTHLIEATYVGADYPEVSSTVSQVVKEPGNFGMGIAPGSRTVYRGDSAKAVISVEGTGGFAGTVMLSCSGLPDESACVFSPTEVKGGGNVALTIKTTDWHKAAAGFGGGVAAGFLLLLWPVRKRRPVWLLALMVATLGMGAGCGGDLWLVGGTPPGVYSVQITGSAVIGGVVLRHSVVERLTVRKF